MGLKSIRSPWWPSGLGTFCLLSLPLGTLLLLSILVFLIRILPFFALLSLALSCSQHFAYLVGMFFPLKLVYISLPSNLSLKSPVQVRCTILDAWAWCTGTTQRDGMGREEGGGFRMGNTCIPVADSFRYLAKPIQYCKV